MLTRVLQRTVQRREKTGEVLLGKTSETQRKRFRSKENISDCGALLVISIVPPPQRAEGLTSNKPNLQAHSVLKQVDQQTAQVFPPGHFHIHRAIVLHSEKKKKKCGLLSRQQQSPTASNHQTVNGST